MRQVALAIFTNGCRILLGKRAPDNLACPNLWDIIGGHAEAGESLVQPLLREAHEEVGVIVHDFVELGTIIEPRPAFGGPAKYHIYVVTRWAGQITNLGNEHTELRWFAID